MHPEKKDVEMMNIISEHKRQSDAVIAEVLSTSQANQRAIQSLSDKLITHIHAEELELLRIHDRLNSIPDVEHETHHDFISSLIQESKERRNFWLEQRSRLATAGLWGGSIIIGGAVWFLVKEWLASKGIPIGR